MTPELKQDQELQFKFELKEAELQLIKNSYTSMFNNKKLQYIRYDCITYSINYISLNYLYRLNRKCFPPANEY